MTLVLRGALALLFVGVAAMVFMFPRDTEVYVSSRYSGLRRFVTYNFPQLPMPKRLFTNAPDLFMQGIAAIIFIGGLFILLNRKLAIAVYAYLVLTVGGVLHIPYDGHTLVAQTRKLIFVFATFFALLTLASREERAEMVRPARNETEKAKAE